MDEKVARYIRNYAVTDGTMQFLTSCMSMYINGEFVGSKGREVTDVLEPCTEGVLAQTPIATLEDVDCAVRAAKSAFEHGEWSRYKPKQREEILRKLADLIEENALTISEIESLNAGKAITGCRRVDIEASLSRLRYMAGWATKLEGSTRPVSAEGEHFAYTVKEPVGVVGAIVPWNWPLGMAILKFAAPLAVGCSVVLKPAEITPMSMIYLSRLCDQAGLPPGALNIVLGNGSTIGDRIVRHPDVSKISFTGSTPVGKAIGKAAMDKVAHVTLELGGKSPMIAFCDAEIESVLSATQNSVFFNSGQVCSAGSRLYVQRDIYETVVDTVAEKARTMKLGDTLDPDTEMGPLISRHQYQSVLNYIEQGKAEGATLVCGGGPANREGYFVEPTVFSDCTNDMEIVQEEIFGPVLAILPFETEEQVIELANDNIYGLGASIFTRDIARVHRCIKKLKAGTVWVNTHDIVESSLPFGGVKQSGLGKDNGPEQIEHFLETKTVWIDING